MITGRTAVRVIVGVLVLEKAAEGLALPVGEGLRPADDERVLVVGDFLTDRHQHGIGLTSPRRIQILEGGFHPFVAVKVLLL